MSRERSTRIWTSFRMPATSIGQPSKRIPRMSEAWVAWGDLLARKYKETDAIENYKEALKIDPRMPEALLEYARNLCQYGCGKGRRAIQGRSSRSIRTCRKPICLRRRSSSSPSSTTRRWRASTRRWPSIRSMAEAFSLAAASTTCRAILPNSTSYKEKVLAANPQYSKLYYTLAESCGFRPPL